MNAKAETHVDAKAEKARKARELLEKALNELDVRGWGTGQLKLPTGEVCARGALMYAAGFTLYESQLFQSEECRPDSTLGVAETAVARILRGNERDALLAGAASIITHFNDQLARDAADVRDLFKRAIDSL